MQTDAMNHMRWDFSKAGLSARIGGRGIGRMLVAAAEEWARSKGCKEMASDTWIDSEKSQRAHEAMGYEIVDRCVNYRKKL